MVERRKRFLRCLLLGAALFSLLAALSSALAGDDAEADKIPRFVSLRSDRINLRVGPGRTYPILWVLTRKGLPVEILRDFNDWRMIRDFEGDKGWVQQSMVTPERTVIVTGKVRALRSRPDPASALVARAEPGVIARLLACRGAWCRIRASGIAGWLKRNEIWGVRRDARAP
jgi:SH3-like domain-containing protein